MRRNMTEQQNKLLQMLSWFHDTCVKNNLRYYIIAGTMLGAIRHNGFIPWDDDIDVGMPRRDYEKLRELSKEVNENNHYILEYPDSQHSEYPYLIAKLYDSNTTLIEKKRYPIKRGIYIDIFPLDGIGNNIEEATTNYKPFYNCFRLHLMITAPFLKRYSLPKNFAVLCGRLISPLFVRRKTLERRIDYLCKRFDFDDSKLVSNLLGGSAIKGIVPKEYFGTPTLIQFENIEVYGLEKPDLYLKSMYGNFMELPPVEKRVSLHDSIECDLNKSYLDIR